MKVIGTPNLVSHLSHLNADSEAGSWVGERSTRPTSDSLRHRRAVSDSVNRLRPCKIERTGYRRARYPGLLGPASRTLHREPDLVERVEEAEAGSPGRLRPRVGVM